MATEAANFQNSSGSWQPVDNNVVADPNLPGGFTNSANSWHVHFGSTRQGIDVESGAGALAVVPVGAANVAPTIDSTGHGVVYANVWPGVDLTYRVFGDGVEESVMIKTPQAGSSFKFAVDTGASSTVLSQVNGGTAGSSTGASSLSTSSSGAMAASQPTTSTVQIGKPLVIDHNGSGLGQAQASMATSNNQLVLSVSSSWLASQPASAFPINLDPVTGPVKTGGVEGFKSDGTSCTSGCYVQFGNPNDTGSTYWRSVVHFQYETLFGDAIQGVSINPLSWNGGTQNQYQASVYEASAASYAGAIGNGTVLAQATPAPPGWQAFSSPSLKATVKGWVDSATPNKLIGFRGTDTANTYTYQEFTMQMWVTYDEPPNVPVSLGWASASPALPPCATGSSRPTVDGTRQMAWHGKLYAPDTGDALGIQFQYWDLATPSSKVLTSVSNTVTEPNFATGGVAPGGPPPAAYTFTDGHNYAFQARGYDPDGQVYSGWTTATCEFHVSDPPPNTPTSLSFASPVGACGSAVMRSDGAIEFEATVSDPDGKNVRGDFSVTPTISGPAWTSNSAFVAGSGQVLVTMPANTVPNLTTFTWTVKSDNQQFTSAAASCTGSTNNTQPVAPTISDGGVFGQAGAVAGHIGDSDTITITSSTSAKIVWAATTNAPLSSLPAPSATCGNIDANGVHTVCASQGSGWNQFSYRAMSTTIYVSAQAYTSAGTPSALVSQTFTVSEWPLTHEWLTDGSSVGDTSVTDNIGSTPLTLSSSGSGIESDGTSYGNGLAFDGTGYASTGSATPTIQIDMTHSFTVAAWVRPHAASSTNVANVALAEEGAVNSGLMVGQYAGYWSFCMPHTQTQSATYNGDCAYVAQAASNAYVNTWTLLVAEWDAGVQRMHLYVNGVEPTGSTLSPVSHTSTGAASGAFTIGEGQNVVEYPSWNGDVLDPLTFGGIIDSAQLNYLATCGPTFDLNSSC